MAYYFEEQEGLSRVKVAAKYWSISTSVIQGEDAGKKLCLVAKGRSKTYLVPQNSQKGLSETIDSPRPSSVEETSGSEMDAATGRRGGNSHKMLQTQEMSYRLVHATCVRVQIRATGPQEILQEKDQAYISGLRRGGIPRLLIFGHPLWRGAGRSQDLLMGLLLGLAKLAIYRPRQRVVVANCLPLFCGYVRSPLSLKKEHTVSTNTPDAFQEMLTLQGVDGFIIESLQRGNRPFGPT
eukprot:g34113.t1